MTPVQQEKYPPERARNLLCLKRRTMLLVRTGATEARELFERLLSLRNDVGLLSEEYDLEARRLTGNFPQALSHIALVNTADNLTRPDGPAQQRISRRNSRQ